MSHSPATGEIDVTLATLIYIAAGNIDVTVATLIYTATGDIDVTLATLIYTATGDIDVTLATLIYTATGDIDVTFATLIYTATGEIDVTLPTQIYTGTGEIDVTLATLIYTTTGQIDVSQTNSPRRRWNRCQLHIFTPPLVRSMSQLLTLIQPATRFRSILMNHCTSQCKTLPSALPDCSRMKHPTGKQTGRKAALQINKETPVAGGLQGDLSKHYQQGLGLPDCHRTAVLNARHKLM